MPESGSTHDAGSARSSCLRDDDALHLVGALADDQQRRVAVEPLDGEFLRVAVAAVDAHRLGAFSTAASVANSLAMPASMSQRSPRS